MIAHARNLRISPKKLSVVALAVRGMEASKALDVLKFMPVKGAQMMYKVLSSAVANAEHNQSQSVSDLVIASVVVNQGFAYKRGNPISRGRSHPILKRTAHIDLTLTVKA